MPGNFSYVADPAKPTLVISRTFDASRGDVFEAWTTPEAVAQWWDPTGAKLAICEIDLRPGGTFRWVHQGELGASHPFTGTYREITPPERLVFETRTGPDGPPQVGTLIFTESENGTTLTMTIECPSIAHRDGMLAMNIQTGTARTLQNLAAYLDRRPT